jgi:hypothetical protein
VEEMIIFFGSADDGQTSVAFVAFAFGSEERKELCLARPPR